MSKHISISYDAEKPQNGITRTETLKNIAVLPVGTVLYHSSDSYISSFFPRSICTYSGKEIPTYVYKITIVKPVEGFFYPSDEVRINLEESECFKIEYLGIIEEKIEYKHGKVKVERIKYFDEIDGGEISNLIKIEKGEEMDKIFKKYFELGLSLSPEDKMMFAIFANNDPKLLEEELEEELKSINSQKSTQKEKYMIIKGFGEVKCLEDAALEIIYDSLFSTIYEKQVTNRGIIKRISETEIYIDKSMKEMFTSNDFSSDNIKDRMKELHADSINMMKDEYDANSSDIDKATEIIIFLNQVPMCGSINTTIQLKGKYAKFIPGFKSSYNRLD